MVLPNGVKGSVMLAGMRFEQAGMAHMPSLDDKLMVVAEQQWQ